MTTIIMKINITNVVVIIFINRKRVSDCHLRSRPSIQSTYILYIYIYTRIEHIYFFIQRTTADESNDPRTYTIHIIPYTRYLYIIYIIGQGPRPAFRFFLTSLFQERGVICVHLCSIYRYTLYMEGTRTVVVKIRLPIMQ